MSGGFSESKSKPKDLTPREFKAQRGFIADLLNQRAQGNVGTIEGPFAAPITAAEQAGLNSLNESVFGASGLGAANDAFLKDALAGGQQNPFLQETINAATRPILEDAALQELRDRAQFNLSGQKIQGSSAFAEDRQRSLRDTERTVGDVASQISYQDFARRTQAQLEASALSNARFQEQRDAITTLALPRLIEQYGIDGANQEMARRMASIEQAIGMLSQLTTPTPVQESSSLSVNADTGLKLTPGGSAPTQTTTP